MAKMHLIYDQAHADPLALFDSFNELQNIKLISGPQHCAIYREALQHLPCRVTLRQRTPLGVVYAQAGEHSFDLDRRGKKLLNIA